MLLNLFRKIKQRKLLEKRILNLISDAEECIDSNPEIGTQYLKQANNDYPKLKYNFKINCKLNGVCFAYINKFL